MLGLEAVYSGRNGDEEDSGSLTDFFFFLEFTRNVRTGTTAEIHLIFHSRMLSLIISFSVYLQTRNLSFSLTTMA